MKKLLVLLLLFTIQFSFSQNRFKPSSINNTANDNVTFTKEGKETSKVSIINQSNVPNSNKDYFYLLEVKNTSNKIKRFNFKTENIACDLHSEHSDINFSFHDASKRMKIRGLVIQPGKAETFYVKTQVPENTKLSSWNCTNIVLYNQTPNEKQVTRIVSQVQDKKNAH